MASGPAAAVVVDPWELIFMTSPNELKAWIAEMDLPVVKKKGNPASPAIVYWGAPAATALPTAVRPPESPSTTNR